jgi:protein-tyrosine phosphatase
MNAEQPRIKVLFICMGNICRSPLGEGVMKRLVQEAGLSESIEVDSAATHSYQVGNPPDPRSIEVAARHGYSIEAQRCRLVTSDDFETFTYLLAMDKRNLRDLEVYAPTGAPSAELAQKPRLLLAFSREPFTETEVPDPYYGGEEGFEHVLRLVEAGCRGLLQSIRETYAL